MLERIFSSFPWYFLKRERLPRNRVSTFPYVRPLLFAERLLPFSLPPRLPDWIHWFSTLCHDAYVAKMLPACDLFVGHEAVGLRSGRAAKRRGIPYICDRGCTHIGFRQKLFEDEFDRHGLSEKFHSSRTIERELKEYDLADLIVVPSTFAYRSFLAEGFPEEKLAVVPYGMDIEVFTPTLVPDDEWFDILFVGNFSIRKGAPYLLDAFKRFTCKRKRLSIVGSINPDANGILKEYLRTENEIKLYGHLGGAELRDMMSRSHVLALPSIEDGFGLVMGEALACGCPVIATTNTGAEDLFRDGVEGFIIPIRDADALIDRFSRLADNKQLRADMSHAARSRAEKLDGWATYGEKMVEVYSRVLENN